MNKENRAKRSDGARADEAACDELAGKVGDAVCDRVLVEVCKANRRAVKVTIWDLPRVTGLPLHEIFAAVRTLEFGRLLKIGDNPSDPFGATLTLESAAAARLAELGERQRDI